MTRLLVGGLGDPHDRLAAAALRAEGLDATPLGPLDGEALDCGRRVLPRGQCAPALYTTGALLRSVAERGPATYLTVQSCGPCRYALFEDLWSSALRRAGIAEGVSFARLDRGDALLDILPSARGWRLAEAALAADAIDRWTHHWLPRSESVETVCAEAKELTGRTADAIGRGLEPLSALAAARAGIGPLRPRRPAALARAVLIGDPWSLHAHGDGQLHLPRVLAAAGVEIEAQPLALWIAYLLWTSRQPDPRTGRMPGELTRAHAIALAERLALGYAAACATLGRTDAELVSIDRLAALAEPFLDPALRGGYGHVEVGLAVRAAQERRGHLLISVKSFGCLPSGAVSDAVIPTALGGALPFLALEVCGDGDAARESRLMMRVAEARARATAEDA